MAKPESTAAGAEDEGGQPTHGASGENEETQLQLCRQELALDSTVPGIEIPGQGKPSTLTNWNWPSLLKSYDSLKNTFSRAKVVKGD